MRAALASRIHNAKNEVLPPDTHAIAVLQASGRFDGDTVDTHAVPACEVLDDASLVIHCNPRVLARNERNRTSRITSTIITHIT